MYNVHVYNVQYITCIYTCTCTSSSFSQERPKQKYTCVRGMEPKLYHLDVYSYMYMYVYKHDLYDLFTYNCMYLEWNVSVGVVHM